MTLTIFHDRLANTTLLYAALLALWSFWRFFRKQKLDPSFSGALVIGELLFLAQGLIGLILAFSGNFASLTRPSMHILYGIVSVLVIPGLYVYTRADERYQVMLLYGVGFIFLAFIFMRSMATGA